jgi:hypothetical protein
MRHFCLTILILITYGTVAGQELSPRFYWPAPKGTKVWILGYSYSWGDVLTDPSLPIVGLDSRIHVGFAAYLQTLNVFGRTTNFLIEIPYVVGHSEGEVYGESRTRDISGIADIGITLAVNLIGAPSLTPKDFQELRNDPHPILGASIKVLIPMGVYEEDKLINVGANRWAVKPEMGFVYPLSPGWLLEFELGAWFFETNEEFYGATREQNPIIATEFHIVKEFKSGLWGALDFNLFSGGQTTVNGERRADLQRNTRFGFTILYPFLGRHALKAGFSIGLVTESGSNFRQFLLSYSLLLN